MITIINTLSNQGIREMHIGEPQGFIDIKDEKIEAKHLIYAYLGKLALMNAKKVKGKWEQGLIDQPAQFIAYNLGLSVQYVRRIISALEINGDIARVGIKDRVRIYALTSKYDGQYNHLVPDGLLFAEVPTDFKLFILRLNVAVKANEKHAIVFKSDRELREYAGNDHYILNGHEEYLKKEGLIKSKVEDKKLTRIIDLKDVFQHLNSLAMKRFYDYKSITAALNFKI